MDDPYIPPGQSASASDAAKTSHPRATTPTTRAGARPPSEPPHFAPGHLHDEGATPRNRKLGAALWLAPYFFVYVSFGSSIDAVVLPTRFAEWACLGALLLLTALGPTTRREARQVSVSLVLLVTIASIYEVTRGVPQHAEREDYIRAALVFCIIYGLTIGYGALLFREREFVDVFYRIAVISAIIAAAAYIASLLLGRALMVNAWPGAGLAAYRLHGLLPEPSAWAPVVPALLILGWRRRDWKVLLLTFVAMILTQSPTVFAVTAASIGLYLLLATSWSRGRPFAVVLVASLTALGTWSVMNTGGEQWARSDNPVQRTVGRLVVGFDAVLTGVEDPNANDRLVSTWVVLRSAEESGHFYTGNGANASSARFDEDQSGPVRANSIWVRAVYDFGWLGATALVLLMAAATLRIRRRPELAGIFLPIMAASMVNSAGGHQLYKMVLLAILLFGFGWQRPIPG